MQNVVSGRHHEVVWWECFGEWLLMLLTPLPNSLKVLALVICIEIRERLRVLCIVPNLTKDSSIRIAH